MILNSDEIDAWLFEHTVILGHACHGIKGEVNGEEVNIKFIDDTTKETISVVYKERSC